MWLDVRAWINNYTTQKTIHGAHISHDARQQNQLRTNIPRTKYADNTLRNHISVLVNGTLLCILKKITTVMYAIIVIRKLRGTIVNIILPPRVSFYRREIYFAAASFILLPRVLFYCREFCFTAASFILAPRVLYYCREFYYTAARSILPPRVLFSPLAVK